MTEWIKRDDIWQAIRAHDGAASVALLKMRFDAADRYAALLPGHRYQLTTVGFRVPFLSLFPNVIDARDLTRGS